MGPGRVVILNGTSSAGKTTIATAFRDERARLGEFWLLVGIDDVLSKLTLDWYDLDLESGPGAFASDGLFFVRGPAGVRLGVGPLLHRLLGEFRRSVASASLAGIDVIVDEVVLDEIAADGWRTALEGLPVTWVAVCCDMAIAEARESARGDRPLGMVRAQYHVVHRGIPYDLEIDTGHLSPDEALAALRRGLGC